MKTYIISLLSFFILFSFIKCGKEELVKKYSIEIDVSPEGSGTVSPQSGEYDENTSVTITATPNNGYEFSGWSERFLSGNPLTLPMTRNLRMTAYMRRVADADGDGIPDSSDQCPNSPSGASVNSQGCSNGQLDSDGDGVFDDVDQDNNTREGVPVDDNGIMLSPIYIDSNGVTIKAYDWAIIGDIGEVDGIEYML